MYSRSSVDSAQIKQRANDNSRNKKMKMKEEEERAEIGRLHKQAEAKNAFENGHCAAATKNVSFEEFAAGIKQRITIRIKELEELCLLPSEDIETIVASEAYESELLDGFQFERQREPRK